MKKDKKMFVLDITINGGQSYATVGLYTDLQRAKKAVEDYIQEYNDTRDQKRGEVEFQYKDDIWFATDHEEIVFPFGVGAEFRIRQLRINARLGVKD